MQSLETDTLEDAHNRCRMELMHYANTKHGKKFLLDAVNRLIVLVEGGRISATKAEGRD